MPATETIADRESAADTDAREAAAMALADTKPDAGADGTLIGSLTIPGRLKLVATARAFTAMMLSDRFACAPDAVSLVSELVANSIRHSDSGRHGGTVTIALFDLGGRLRAEVTDAGGRGTPALRGVVGHRVPGEPGQEAEQQDTEQPDFAEAGRGLQLVDRLSARWAWRRTGAGTVTWFELGGA